MGAGASAVSMAKGLNAACEAASPDDLKEAVASLSSEERQKLMDALAEVEGGAKAKEVPAAVGEVTAAVLAKQNSETSQAILEANAGNPAFQKLSEKIGKEIVERDTQDGEKLAKGITLAVGKGVLPADVTVEPTTKVSVTGKSADAVADEIIKALGDAPSKGCVMTLQGLSGTGKGTTVAKLSEKLPKAQTWSNGNVFRSITLLAVTYTEQEKCSMEDAIKPENLAKFCDMLEFDKFGDKFDVKIEGLGLKYMVSDVEKTVLKESKVGKNIPTVAEVTQGEVVTIVSGGLAKMAADGFNVLVEGREQTLNHIRTPHRFELVLDDSTIVGKRQAALQVGGKAWDKLERNTDADTAAVKAAIDEAIAALG
jgi:cytidylate kinase